MISRENIDSNVYMGIYGRNSTELSIPTEIGFCRRSSDALELSARMLIANDVSVAKDKEQGEWWIRSDQKRE